MSRQNQCVICQSPVTLIFKKRILQKYDVSYFKCQNCDFIQTEDPYWFEEAYSDAITSLDIGLLDRNIALRNRLYFFIKRFFNAPGSRYLDYAGGYGTFTRLMRDWWFNFYHIDQYCPNIFAKDFEAKESDKPYTLLTAFELFEHMVDPHTDMQKMLTYGRDILFTTELQPAHQPVADWWYIVPETGQHIAFHTVKSLEILAKSVGLNFYTDGLTLHLFTTQTLPGHILCDNLVKRIWRKLRLFLKRSDGGLLQSDLQLIRQRLQS